MSIAFDTDPFEIGAEWIDSNSLAFQIEGNDLVHVSDIDTDGTATITVFTSSHPDASIVFTAQVNVFAHREENYSTESSTLSRENHD
jgi:hypothetical protein